MSRWLPDGKFNVYGVGLYREKAPPGCPNLAFKPGLTASLNPLVRIHYKGSDEPYPITEAFPKTCVIDFVTCSCKEEAKWLEALIQEVLRDEGRPFHDRRVWNEPSKIINGVAYHLCGITEMCPWDEKKCCLFLAILEAYREGRLVWPGY